MHVCTYVCIYVCMYVCLYVCVYVILGSIKQLCMLAVHSFVGVQLGISMPRPMHASVQMMTISILVTTNKSWTKC